MLLENDSIRYPLHRTTLHRDGLFSCHSSPPDLNINLNVLIDDEPFKNVLQEFHSPLKLFRIRTEQGAKESERFVCEASCLLSLASRSTVVSQQRADVSGDGRRSVCQWFKQLMR